MRSLVNERPASSSASHVGDEGSEELLEEPDVLEYARFHGLCRDYTQIHPLRSNALPCAPPDIFQDLEDSVLPQPEQPEHIFLGEKWHIDKEAGLYLKNIYQLTESTDDLEYPTERYKLQALRVDSPLLRTDPELDIRYFTRGRITQPKLNSTGLESFLVDEEKNEGLQWSSSTQDLVTRMSEELGGEKLQVPMSSLEFLKATLHGGLANKDEEEALIAEDLARRPKMRAHESPPLLPISRTPSPAVPSPSVGLLPLTSSPADLLADDLLAVDEQIMKQDQWTTDSALAIPKSELDDASTSVPLFANSSSSPGAKRVKPEDCKVEGPLTPPTVVSPPFKKVKTVSFLKDLVDTIPDNWRPPDPTESEDADKGYEQLFDAMIETAAAPAVHEAEHEQLHQGDSNMRVPIPNIVHIPPQPPWEQYTLRGAQRDNIGKSELDAQRRLIASILKLVPESARVWHGVTKLEKCLKWGLFPPYLGRVASTEDFDDGSLDRYLAKMCFNDEPDSSALLWKPEGLRVLDTLGHDDETIKPIARTSDCSNIDALVRKRQAEMREKAGPDYGLVTNNDHEVTASTEVERGHTQHRNYAGQPAYVTQSGDERNTMLTGNFSASGWLSRFMQVDSGRLEANAGSKEIKGAGIATSMDPIITPAQQRERPATTTIGKMDVPPTLALPSFTPPPGAQQYIISTTLLTQRGLLREIERLYPAAELIERDFGAKITIAEANTPDALEEADILVSPGTGVVLTNLQKIKQKALPGQAATTGIRDRIARLALRYERLIVLVSEGASASAESQIAATPLDERDCEALSSLVGFTTLLDADIQVFYVPADEGALAAWIVSCMARFGLSDSNVKLLQDETLWEAFLRQAGMDAFAAQAILASLKGNGDSNTKVSGLAAFVMMNVDERIIRFGTLMGGERVLGRVSKVIDQSWVPAAGMSAQVI